MRVSARHERSREIRRIRPHAAVERAESEAALLSDSASERRAAASRLGKLGSVSSYGPLHKALTIESGLGKGESREVEIAIFRALDALGSAHSSSAAIRAGREPMKKFVLSHLGDAALAKEAFSAMRWTGTVDETSKDAVDIKLAARQAGHQDTALAASTFYLQLVER
jgi:hypothetical protein